VLSFGNAAVDADLTPAPGGYLIVWSWFDNTTGDVRAVESRSSRSTTVVGPDGLLPREGAFLRVEISARAAPDPSWEVPVHAYFRGDGREWNLVGFERIPEGAAASDGQQFP
jgi:hypothetical protein